MTKKPIEDISATHKARLMRIDAVVKWIKGEMPKVMGWLKGEVPTVTWALSPPPKFWFEGRKVFFDELPDKTKEIIYARFVRRALRNHIFINYGFCDATIEDYIKHALRRIGCKYRRRYWRCPIIVKNFRVSEKSKKNNP